MFRLLILTVMMTVQTPVFAPVFADASLSVYVRSKGAKFIADYTGGASVSIVDKNTGRLLAKGITKGSTGRTQKIMSANTWQDLTTPDSAFYLAKLPIEEPTLIEITVTGPLDYPEAANTVSQTMWAFPDDSNAADRKVIIEIAGLIVTPDKLSINNDMLTVTAEVRMLCGCPLSPGGTWESTDYRVWAELHNKQGRLKTLDMSYSKNSRFSGTFTLDGLDPRELSVKIFALSKDHQNTGMAVYTLDQGEDAQ